MGALRSDAALRGARMLRSALGPAIAGWLEEDAASVADRYRAGELDVHDLVRRYGVIVDWGSGELLPETTRQFRAMLARRSVPGWS